MTFREISVTKEERLIEEFEKYSPKHRPGSDRQIQYITICEAERAPMPAFRRRGSRFCW
jgi:hypothetical protein